MKQLETEKTWLRGAKPAVSLEPSRRHQTEPLKRALFKAA
jgi:hypothetical protein